MDEYLKKLRKDLDAEIDKMGDIDHISREKLDELVSCVDMKLQDPQNPAHHNILIGQLLDDIHHFEVTHPDLTMVMNRMLTILSNLGI
jgi:hypothetical protein